MYKIIGSDGKEYGPFELQEMLQWISQGRVNGQTQVQGPGAAGWSPAANFPELGLGATPGAFTPPPLPAGPPMSQETGLATASLVLGILSFACLGFLTAIPAIICGHMARSRVRRLPAQYGGAGMALTGLILGYVSLAATFVILPAMLLPALSKAKERAQRISCVNHMKQIGLAEKMWAIDNDNNFPFNVSTTNGGTLELCLLGPDGFDKSAFYHFRVLSNELNTTRILVCPEDNSKKPALDFASLAEANVTYLMHSGTNLTEANPQEAMVICPIHNNVLHCDGSVTTERKSRR